MQFINPSIAASICDISINTRLRIETKNENADKNTWKNLTKEEGKILLRVISKYCGAYNNITWVRFLKVHQVME